MIRVQAQAFDTAAELAKLKQGRTDIGGSVVFVGTMRDMSDGAAVSAMTLEHYPGMTEKALAEIDAEAQRRWPLLDTLIVHRYGKLLPGDDIVLPQQRNLVAGQRRLRQNLDCAEFRLRARRIGTPPQSPARMC